MDPTIYTQLGIGGAALFIIWMIVKYFMSTLDKKDEYIKGLIKDFQHHIELCNIKFLENSQLVARNAEKQTKAFNELMKRVKILEK